VVLKELYASVPITASLISNHVTFFRITEKLSHLHNDARVGSDTLYSRLANLFPNGKKLALTGHSSAASFPTGPVMAEPFISPFAFTI
jgi:hypothetical protein